MTATSAHKPPLFVTDLDGTLLGADSRVSPRSADILRSLSEEGVWFTAATARTPATADMLLRGAGFKLPLVVMTGAALWDPVGHRYMWHNPMGTDTQHVVRSAMDQCGLHPFVYVLDAAAGMLHCYHNGPMTRREQAFADERSHLPLKRLHFDHPDGLKCFPDTVLFLAIGPLEQVERCASMLRRKKACSVSAYPDIFNREVGLLEVFAPGVSKAAAIEMLARQLGAGELTVFGDNLNDIPMLEAAHRAVAVANAMPQVRAMAHEVIGRNIDDAVPLYIQRVSQQS